MIYVAMYLVAIVVANLVTSAFGPNASIVNAFVLIGLDLTARDRLHDAWHNNNLVLKMSILIGFGSLLSWVLNKDAGMIAVASFVAFGSAAIADTIIYQILREKSWMVKVNGSNLVSSAVDSLVFPTIAFGGVMIWVTIAQFVAKILGGFIWSLILKRK